jgi:hypothetical protein
MNFVLLGNMISRSFTFFRLDDRGFVSRQGLGIFLLTIASRPSVGSTQPPIQWVSGFLSLRVKEKGREADYSPPSSAEVKERVELYLHSPNTPSWHGAQLKHRGNFTVFPYLYAFRRRLRYS